MADCAEFFIKKAKQFFSFCYYGLLKLFLDGMENPECDSRVSFRAPVEGFMWCQPAVVTQNYGKWGKCFYCIPFKRKLHTKYIILVTLLLRRVAFGRFDGHVVQLSAVNSGTQAS